MWAACTFLLCLCCVCCGCTFWCGWPLVHLTAVSIFIYCGHSSGQGHLLNWLTECSVCSFCSCSLVVLLDMISHGWLRGLAAAILLVLVAGLFPPDRGRSSFGRMPVLARATCWVWQGSSHFMGTLISTEVTCWVNSRFGACQMALVPKGSPGHDKGCQQDGEC